MKDIISKRRKELGLTQQDLADKLFVSDKVISKWETGKSVPDTSILVELSKALEISLDELLQSNEPINKNTQLAVADTLSIKFKNVMLVSYSLAIISAIFFVISRLIDYNDYKRENKVFVWLFLGLALVLLTACITYYLINRNKLLIDYPKFQEIDKKNFNQFMNVMGMITIIVSAIYVFTFETMHKLEHFFEALFVLVIVLAIELVIWLFIKHLYSKKNH